MSGVPLISFKNSLSRLLPGIIQLENSCNIQILRMIWLNIYVNGKSKYHSYSFLLVDKAILKYLISCLNDMNEIIPDSNFEIIGERYGLIWISWVCYQMNQIAKLIKSFLILTTYLILIRSSNIISKSIKKKVTDILKRYSLSETTQNQFV